MRYKLLGILIMVLMISSCKLQAPKRDSVGRDQGKVTPRYLGFFGENVVKEHSEDEHKNQKTEGQKQLNEFIKLYALQFKELIGDKNELIKLKEQINQSKIDQLNKAKNDANALADAHAKELALIRAKSKSDAKANKLALAKAKNDAKANEMDTESGHNEIKILLGLTDKADSIALQKYLNDFREANGQVRTNELLLGLIDAKDIYGAEKIRSYVLANQSTFHLLAIVIHKAKMAKYSISVIKAIASGLHRGIVLYGAQSVLKRLDENPLATAVIAYGIKTGMDANYSNSELKVLAAGVDVALPLFGLKAVIEQFSSKPYETGVIASAVYYAKIQKYNNAQIITIAGGIEKAISLFGGKRVFNALSTKPVKVLVIAHAIKLGLIQGLSDKRLVKIQVDFAVALDIWPTQTVKNLLNRDPLLAERYAAVASDAQSRLSPDGSRLYSNEKIKIYLAQEGIDAAESFLKVPLH